MELKWLEDFVSLAGTLSFSRSAEERNVTQPAFSRRIRALEAWIGVDLIDRSSYPISLTGAGKLFRDVAEELLTKAHNTRNVLRGKTASGTTVRIAAPAALILSFVAEWLMKASNEVDGLVPRVTAANTYEALLSIVEGGSCDFAIVYHHPQIPVSLPGNRYPWIHLEHDSLVPLSKADARGYPIFDLNSRLERVPFVAYPSTLFMGQLVELIMARSNAMPRMQICYETDLLESAKSMIIAGHGVGWVPRRLVTKELETGSVVPAGPTTYTEPIDVRIYFALDNRRALPHKLWTHLCRAHGKNNSDESIQS